MSGGFDDAYQRTWAGVQPGQRKGHFNFKSQGFERTHEHLDDDAMALKDPKNLKRDSAYRSSGYRSDSEGRGRRRRSRSRGRGDGGGARGGRGGMRDNFNKGVILTSSQRKRSDAAKAELVGKVNNRPNKPKVNTKISGRKYMVDEINRAGRDQGRGKDDWWDSWDDKTQRKKVTAEDYFMQAETIGKQTKCVEETITMDLQEVLTMRPKKRATWFDKAMSIKNMDGDTESNLFNIAVHRDFWHGLDLERCMKIRGTMERQKKSLSNRKRDQIYDHLEKAEKDAEKKQKERERQQGGGGKKKEPEAEEYRIDAADGSSYSFQEFLDQYGGSEHKPPAEWESAEPVGKFKNSTSSGTGFKGFSFGKK